MADSKKRAPAGPMRRMKGEVTFEHNLFKLVEAELLHNVSWKQYQPKLVPMKHGHIFHSVNDRTGTPNIYSSPIGGHFHEVKTEWAHDEEGNLILVKAECGPALCKVKRKLRSGEVKTVTERVAFLTDDETRPHVDDHTHEVLYIDTEEINPTTRQRQVESDRQKIMHLTKNAVPQVTQAPKEQAELVEMT